MIYFSYHLLYLGARCTSTYVAPNTLRSQLIIFVNYYYRNCISEFGDYHFCTSYAAYVSIENVCPNWKIPVPSGVGNNSPGPGPLLRVSCKQKHFSPRVISSINKDHHVLSYGIKIAGMLRDPPLDQM